MAELPRRIQLVYDGVVVYDLVRDEAVEAEITSLVKEMPDTIGGLDPNTPIHIYDPATEHICISLEGTKVHSNAEMGAVHTLPAPVVVCPRCGAQETQKYGVRYGTQEYLCTKCRSKFNSKYNALGMRTPAAQIGAALADWYDGNSFTEVSRHLAASRGNYVNRATVFRWWQRYTKAAVEMFSDYQAHTGKIWAADETVLSVRGGKTKEGSENTIWFWDCIDEDSRFLLGSHMSNTRTIRDAEALFNEAARRSTTAPRFIVTDKLNAYLDGIERVFGSESQHVQSRGMASSTHNNIIERFRGTIKERTKVMRDLKGPESARLVMDGWLVHYNFFRPHMGLGGKTPAEAAGIKYDVRSWTDVVKRGD
jgi:transposase-like protein